MHRRLLNGESIVITPRDGRDARSVGLAIGLAAGPPLIALLVLTWETPGLSTVVSVGAAFLIAGSLAAYAVHRTEIVFAPTEIAERNILGRRSVTPLSELSSVRAVNVYSGRSLETHTQVFFLDAAGNTRVRIKGHHWGDRVAARASTAYDLPLDKVADPLARAELRQRYGSTLHRYERHPVAWFVAQMAIVFAVGAPFLGILTAVT